MSLRQHFRLLREFAGYDIGKPPSVFERWDRAMASICDAPTFHQVERKDATDRTAGMKLEAPNG